MLFGDASGCRRCWRRTAIEQRIKALEPSFSLRQIDASREKWNSPSFRRGG